MQMFSRSTIWLLAVLILIGCTDNSTGPEPIPNEQQKTQMSAMLDSLVVLGRVSGAVLAIRFPDGDVWTGFSGVADLSTNRDLTTTTPFKVGSISKTFTATVVLNLVKEGQVELDNPLAMYLPDSIAAYLPTALTDSIITVRRTLNHTTGIVNYVHLPAFTDQYVADWTRTWRPEELIAFTRDTLWFDPGTNWAYSNTNYIFLGLMVEHLTGHSLKQEIQEVILDPLNLEHTSFPENVAELPADIAQGYYDFNGDSTLEQTETITDASPSAAWAAGAIVSTSDDMLTWLDALVDGSLLTPELQHEREITIDFTLGSDQYGYGLGIARQDAVAWGHQGGIDGFGAIINQHDAGYDFAILVNSESPVTSENFANIIYVTAVDKLINAEPSSLHDLREGKILKTRAMTEIGYGRGAAVFK